MARLGKILALFLALAVVIGAVVLGGISLHRHYLISRRYAPPPEGMVIVPAGYFLRGSNDPEAAQDEQPLRRVFLPAFYIDRYTVTNRQFGAVFPQHVYPSEEANLPVTHVLKSEAEAYARAVGKRLPTGAEWEKAARGTDGRRYPWGNDFRPECANVQRRDLRAPRAVPGQSCALRPGRKRLGGSYPCGISPYGAYDMAGNVWEWVADVQQNRGPLGLPLGPPRGVLRGGAYGYGPFQARSSYQAFEALDATCNDTGFRCAQDA